MSTPSLIIFAGPNGSGKSSLMEKISSLGVLPKICINTDKIAGKILGKAFNEATPEEFKKANEDAAIAVKKMRYKYIAKGISFALETVLSTTDKINFMREAKAKGYHVDLQFITTQDARINVQRVRSRFATGGHDVSEDKIKSRHYKSNYYISEALQIADTASVYDNSYTDEYPSLVLVKTGKNTYKHYPLSRQDILSSFWSSQSLLSVIRHAKEIDRRFREIAAEEETVKISKTERTYYSFAKQVIAQTNNVYFSYDHTKTFTMKDSTDAKVYNNLVASDHKPAEIYDILLFSPCVVGKPVDDYPVRSLMSHIQHETYFTNSKNSILKIKKKSPVHKD